ncbi:hypothetical protein HYU19_04910 [Candidatus Woesearchaeota archaeon]|nr:hypothetical protein [Candidatus Woesearchaeota archaeon]
MTSHPNDGTSQSTKLGVKKWRCLACGYIHEGDTPPQFCPKCGAPPEEFELLEEMGGVENDPLYDQLLREEEKEDEQEGEKEKGKN